MGSDFDSTISPDDDDSDIRNVNVVALKIILGRISVFYFIKKSQCFLMTFLPTFLISKFLTNEIQRTAFNASGVKYFNLSKLPPPRSQYRNSEGEPHSDRGGTSLSQHFCQP